MGARGPTTLLCAVLGVVVGGCYQSRPLGAGVDGGEPNPPDGGSVLVDGGRDAGPPDTRTLGSPYRGDACLLWSEQPLLRSPSSVIATADGFFLSSPVQRFDGRIWEGFPLAGPVFLGPDGLVALDADRGEVGFWNGAGWSTIPVPAAVAAPTTGAAVGGRLVVGSRDSRVVGEWDGEAWTTLTLPDAGDLLAVGSLEVEGRERVVVAMEFALYWRGDDAWNGISPFRGIVSLGRSRSSPLFGIRADEPFEVLSDGLVRVTPNGERCRPAAVVASPDTLSLICGARLFRWVGREADDDRPRDGWLGEGTLPREAIPTGSAQQAFGVDTERGGLVGRTGQGLSDEPAPWRYVPGSDALLRLPTVPAPPIRSLAGDPAGVPVAAGEGVFRVEEAGLVPVAGTEGWEVADVWESTEGVLWVATIARPPEDLRCDDACEAAGFACVDTPVSTRECTPRVDVWRSSRDGFVRDHGFTLPDRVAGLGLAGIGETPRVVTGCGVWVRGEDGAWSAPTELEGVRCDTSTLRDDLVRFGLGPDGTMLFGEPARFESPPDPVIRKPYTRFDEAGGVVESFPDGASWRAGLLGDPAYVLLDSVAEALVVDARDGVDRVPAPEGRVLGGAPTGDVLLYRARPGRVGLWDPDSGAYREIVRDGFARLVADEAPGGERAVVSGDAVVVRTQVDQAWFLGPTQPPMLLYCPP